MYPALLAAAAAVTAAILTERLMVKADEQAVASVLAGLELDRKMHDTAGPGLRLVDRGRRLPGSAV